MQRRPRSSYYYFTWGYYLTFWFPRVAGIKGVALACSKHGESSCIPWILPAWEQCVCFRLTSLLQLRLTSAPQSRSLVNDSQHWWWPWSLWLIFKNSLTVSCMHIMNFSSFQPIILSHYPLLKSFFLTSPTTHTLSCLLVHMTHGV